MEIQEVVFVGVAGLLQVVQHVDLAEALVEVRLVVLYPLGGHWLVVAQVFRVVDVGEGALLDLLHDLVLVPDHLRVHPREAVALHALDHPRGDALDLLIDVRVVPERQLAAVDVRRLDVRPVLRQLLLQLPEVPLVQRILHDRLLTHRRRSRTAPA